jgi:hypothetical protein
MTVSKAAFSVNIEFLYALCYYAEFHIFIVILAVGMLLVIMLSVVTPLYLSDLISFITLYLKQERVPKNLQ